MRVLASNNLCSFLLIEIRKTSNVTTSGLFQKSKNIFYKTLRRQPPWKTTLFLRWSAEWVVQLFFVLCRYLKFIHYITLIRCISCVFILPCAPSCSETETWSIHFSISFIQAALPHLSLITNYPISTTLFSNFNFLQRNVLINKSIKI